MKSAWVLLGEANTRKSTTSRLLTGIDRWEGQVGVMDWQGKERWMRSLVSAAQEAKRTPKELLDELNGKNHWQGEFDTVRNAVLVLRYDAFNGCPDGKMYIHDFVNDGWVIQCVVSLGEPARDWVRLSGFQFLEIPNSASLPSNAVAAKVRTAFGWL